MRDFRKYDVWLDGVNFSTEVYRLTQSFPKQEIYGLSNQIQRAAVSIPSNIAEGSSRESESDFARFLEIALGSAYEVETQLQIALNLSYLTSSQWQDLQAKLNSIEKRLSSLILKLRKSHKP